MLNTFSMEFAVERFPEILAAVPMTLLVAVVSVIVGIVLGLGLALCRIHKVPVLGKFAVIYVSFIRGTPAIVQIYMIFYGIPELWLAFNAHFNLSGDISQIPPLLTAFIAFSLNSAAYQSEIIRSALLSVEPGQHEAAYSIGMTPFQSFIRIVFPQMLIVALPNFGNNFISLVKNTSLAFAVKVVEIMAVTKTVGADGYRYLEVYLDASIIYWVLCFLFERLFAFAEKHLSRHEKRTIAGAA